MSENLAADDAAINRGDNEDIRLTTGFADIFTAVVLVVGASALLTAAGALGGLIMIAACFALGPPIVRRRQFAAASSTLAVGVAFGAGAFAIMLLEVFGLLVAAAASAFYWRTFRVPIALALAWGCVSAFLSLLVTVGVRIDLLPDTISGKGGLFGLACGVQLIALALWYDSRDRARQTRLSDVAFWLHLAAAPLLVHGAFAAMGANPFGGTVAAPWLVLAVFGLLTLVSLVIDRRPLLVSSFIYLIAAVASLLAGFRGDVGEADQFADAALAPAVIGVLMLALAAGWTPLRNGLLHLLPEAVRGVVPPPAAGRVTPVEDYSDLPAAEKEPMRLVLGFNDIFVSAGSTMMFLGSIALGYHLTRAWWAPARDELSLLLSPLPWFMIALPALSVWLVAEYFVRIRRMAWPAITSAAWFWLASVAAGVLAAWICAARTVPQHARASIYDVGPSPIDDFTPDALYFGILFGCVLAVGLNLAFWRRHRTPISFAFAIASLLPLVCADLIVGVILSDFARADSDGLAWVVRCLAAGVVAFGLAMTWDRSDRERCTQRSDTAFWLHLLAGLLVVPSLYWLAMQTAAGPALVALGFLALVAMAIAIDRRAPILVALPFVIGTLSTAPGMPGVATVALSLALLGLILRWDQARGLLLGLGSPAATP